MDDEMAEQEFEAQRQNELFVLKFLAQKYGYRLEYELDEEQEELLRLILRRQLLEGRTWDQIGFTEEQMREIRTRDWFLGEC